MRKAWFVYQPGSMHPNVAIIYDHLPTDEAGKNSLRPKILQSHELTDPKWFTNYEGQELQDEVTSSFNILMQYFPYKGTDYNPPVKINLNATNTMIDQAFTQTLEALGPAELR